MRHSRRYETICFSLRIGFLGVWLIDDEADETVNESNRMAFLEIGILECSSAKQTHWMTFDSGKIPLQFLGES